VASVLNTAVFSSAGSKSSTNSFNDCLSSSDTLFLSSIKSSAEDCSAYFDLSSLIAELTEFISESVISVMDFFVRGLPFRYKTASIRVTKSNVLVLLGPEFILLMTLT